MQATPGRPIEMTSRLIYENAIRFLCNPLADNKEHSVGTGSLV